MKETARNVWCWTLFGVLCVVASSWWIVGEAWPESDLIFTLTAKIWACGFGAVGASAIAMVWRRVVPGAGDLMRLAAVGAGLLAASSLGAVVGGAANRPLNVAVASCFVPIIAVVMSGVWGEGSLETTGLWAALAGLGGALLIFPLALRMGVAAYLGLLVPPLAVAAACVTCRRVARGVAMEWAIAPLFAGGAIGLAVMEFVRRISGGAAVQSFSAVPIALDLTFAGLIVLLVLQMDARRYVSQYFIVPALTVLEGVVLLHAALPWRLCVGTVLMGAAAFALWRGERTPDGTSLLRLR